MNRNRSSPDLVLEESRAALRAVLYMRVSTGRQAEHDLSIPDQRSQLKAWCRANGHHVVAEYVEAGASAGDDRRPCGNVYCQLYNICDRLQLNAENSAKL